VRVDRLSSGDNDSLDADETERGVDEGRQESEEVARGTSDAVIVRPRAGVMPEAEADRLAVWTTAGCDDRRIARS
jgi:hypothetical protein